MISRAFEDEINTLHAEVCAGLADPKRITILYALADNPKTVSEIAEFIDAPQPTVSRHLKLLRERGMVESKRQGSFVQYHLGDKRLIEALDLLRAVLRNHLSDRAELVDQWD